MGSPAAPPSTPQKDEVVSRANRPWSEGVVEGDERKEGIKGGKGEGEAEVDNMGGGRDTLLGCGERVSGHA